MVKFIYKIICCIVSCIYRLDVILTEFQSIAKSNSQYNDRTIGALHNLITIFQRGEKHSITLDFTKYLRKMNFNPAY